MGSGMSGANGDNCMIEQLRSGCAELERQMNRGSHIGWRRGRWHLINAGSNEVNNGAESIFDLIISLEHNKRRNVP